MKIKIEIECDNAAFEPNPAREVKEILASLIRRITPQVFTDKRVGANELKLYDHNGNTVGEMKVSE